MNDLQLELTSENLSNSTLIALAWKKSHQYIRTTNWYADNFELDRSSVNLSQLCVQWAKEIKQRELTFNYLELIPAPKTQEWEFLDALRKNSKLCIDWAPKINNRLPLDPKEYPVKLRPLAHIGIKEQTTMTLLMMFLANYVETQQGDPNTSYENVHKNNLINYGNRLYCSYQNDQAEHNYGASHVYSKFFKDYQAFLQRPYFFANQVLNETGPDEEVYLIELDLKQFFDKIDRTKLIKKINTIVNELGNAPSKNASLEHILNQFEKWEWSSQSSINSDICNHEDSLPKGIPQGLVAGGFLANIYLLDFDKNLANNIGTVLHGSNSKTKIELIDYCRYVDDMRLVLIGPARNKENPKPIEQIKNLLYEFFRQKLESLNLEFNNNKTKIEIYRGKSVGISKQLQDIQTKVSGPISFDEAHEQLTQLESLLSVCSENNPDQNNQGCIPNRLASVERNIFDVRNDTLRRFSANKISRMLSTIRHFTAREVDENNTPIAGDWDYLQERMARRLIAVWSRDPSLVLLLKKGLELFPSPKLLEPVLEQFDAIQHQKSNPKEKKHSLEIKKQKAVVHYLLSEIFRHSATVIHKKDNQAIPAQADTCAYFELLQHRAAIILNGQGTTVPTLLVDQARFLLLVRLDTTLEKSTGNIQQDLIFKLAKGFRNISLIADNHKSRIDDQSIATCILLASQLVDDISPLIRSTNILLEQKYLNPLTVLQMIAIQDARLVRRIVNSARRLKLTWLGNAGVSKLVANLYIDIKASKRALSDIKKPIGIFQLISREDNPFANEIMALKLMLALIDKSNEIQQNLNLVIDLAKTQIEFDGYSNPPKYEDINKEIKVVQLKMHKPTFQFENHLKDQSEDLHVLQRIAFAVRASMSGTPDITGFGQRTETKAGYNGLRSTQYKRQIGLYTTPESLGGETASFSAWITTLLSKLLKWPGIRINDQGYIWPDLTIDNVKTILSNRIEELKTEYCQLSEIPTISEIIRPDWEDTKTSLTVAMVQSRLPHKQDFNREGIFLNIPLYRAKHRRHVAKVSKLIIRHIQAQQLDTPENTTDKVDIDIIIWPELAVHQDDMDILVQLSRKTHAIILAGIVFTNQKGIKGPNNQAVWIVPRKHNGNQNEILRYQGKFHMMKDEVKAGIKPWRPYQLMLELKHPKFPDDAGFILTGSICYDATDIKLTADLTNKSNAYLIPALNRDVNTFDNMVEALHYHMYQHVVLVNTGEFGGSYAMAPYKESYNRLIAHATGNDQVAINTFEMNMFDFRKDGVGKSFRSKDQKGNEIERKAPPAGV